MYIFIIVLLGVYIFALKASGFQSGAISLNLKLRMIGFACIVASVVYIFETRLLKLAQMDLPEAVAKAVQEQSSLIALQKQTLQDKNIQEQNIQQMKTALKGSHVAIQYDA